MKAGALALALAGVAFGSRSPAQAATLTAIVERCAPHVAPRTALAVIAVESGGRWWAVNDNDGPTPHFSGPDQAKAYVRRRVAQGGSIDIGLTQLNSAHLAAMRLTSDDAFEPCTNIAMGMTVLADAWRAASERWGRTPYALLKTFEAYNGGPGAWESRSAPLRQRVATYARTVWSQAERLPLTAPSPDRPAEQVRAAVRPAAAASTARARRAIHVVFRGTP